MTRLSAFTSPNTVLTSGLAIVHNKHGVVVGKGTLTIGATSGRQAFIDSTKASQYCIE
jgi:hypothetical protein